MGDGVFGVGDGVTGVADGVTGVADGDGDSLPSLSPSLSPSSSPPSPVVLPTLHTDVPLFFTPDEPGDAFGVVVKVIVLVMVDAAHPAAL